MLGWGVMVGDVQEMEPVDTLIVDDHSTYRTGMCALLGHQPFISSVTEAGSASAALEFASQRTFGLAIIDMILPERSVVQLAK